MITGKNDLVRDLQQKQDRFRKIDSRDNAGAESYEKNTLANLQQAMEKMKGIFRK